MILYFIKVVVVYIVACVPVPNNNTFISRIKNCSRDQSSIVRHFIHSVWRPVFKRYDVKMLEECPLHFARDLFAIQELAKLHYRANLWTCGMCGKSFYREPYLDLHLVSHHDDALTWQDNTVCYADFCDIFRCSGLLQHRRRKRHSGTPSMSNQQQKNAFFDLGINVYEDIDLDLDDDDVNPIGADGRNSKQRASESNALMTTPPRHVLRALDEKSMQDTSGHFVVGFDASSDAIHDPFGYGKVTKTQPRSVTQVGSESWISFRPRNENQGKRSRNLKSEDPEYYTKILTKVDKFLKVVTDKVSKDNFKSDKMSNDKTNFWPDSNDCDEDRMAAVETKCKRLLHDCLSPLILQLSDEDYLQMIETLDRELCWYLTCDRRDLFRGDPVTHLPSKASHFIMLAILFAALACILGMLYYLVWFCF